jgi:hypothetical protein
VRLRILPIVPLLALIFAACGGGGSNSSTTTSAPTTSTTASSSGTAGSDPAAVERAKKLVLVQADFPAGWTGTPAAADTPEDKASNRELADCVGLSGDKAQVADVKGDNFSMGSPVTQVGSEAQIIKDEATFKSDVAAIKGSKFVPCLQQFLSKAIAKQAGTAPVNPQVSTFSVPTFGDVTVVVRLSAGITVQGQTLDLVLDLVLMGKNRAEVTGTFSNVGQPFDQALEKTLIDKLGAKLNAS